MNDARLHIHRVPNDVRRVERKPSEQWFTGYPLEQIEPQIETIAQINPNGFVFHAIGHQLARALPAMVQRFRSLFPSMKLACAIAGDYDRVSEPGYTDGWEDAAIVARDLGLSWTQLNCEIAWKLRPKGSGTTGVDDIHNAAPTMPLMHTTYGAIANVDGNLERAGYQSFGGHSGGGLLEFMQHPAIVGTMPQMYLMLGSTGESGDRDSQLITFDAYARSDSEAITQHKIRSGMQVNVYLQAYNTRPDVLAATSELYPITQWWSLQRGTHDDAGMLTAQCMSELFRANLTIEEFQALHGLVVDGWLGPITARTICEVYKLKQVFKHPQM